MLCAHFLCKMMRFASNRFMPRSLAKTVAPIALAATSLALAANPAQALTLFDGYYAPANWTQTIQPDGSISTGGAPASITLTGADNGGGTKNTDLTIAAPSGGTVSVNWSYSTAENQFYDRFGYLLNGAFTQLTDNSGAQNQTGSASFNVLAGDVFGFRQNSVDSIFGRASTTISNFNGPVAASVPGPLPLLGAGAAFGWSRQLRKRIGTSGSVKSAAGLEG
jgi:hypothetical protein